ncbi:MFS transporter [Subtercola sp. Z020]|uniref:MFS transporter n=1 Tax=Subtercola sp. Z020 TaxID=2080582 RepID=UPI00130EA578|nr:MFS transporter [Subtercola sp. Z020]
MLALPHVPLTFGLALLGRAAYALVLLPLLYAVTDATGSIALAGLAVAIYGAAASFLAPLRAWFIDRFGARPVLAILTSIFGGTILGLAILSLAGADGALLIGLAGVAGAVAPPLGPTMRVAWGSLAPTPELLRKGLSLDSVVEELLYLAGPAAAGLALAIIAPGAALVVPAALVLVGGLLFVCTPTVGAMTSHSPHDPTRKQARSLLFQPRFVGLLLPVLVAGTVSGTMSVAIPVALTDHGGSAAAGVALGLFAGGSALGGLLYGALRVPGSAARQLVGLASLLLVTSSLVALTNGFLAVSIVLAAAGLFFSPVMIVAYVAAHTAGGEHQRNAATTWVNTSHNIGGAAGSAIAGVLIQSAGTPTAILAIGAAAAVLLATSALLARATPR